MSRASMTRWDALIMASLGLLTVAHYAIPAHTLWMHVLLFWLFQIPILIGGISRGVRGGLSTAILATLMLLPHAVGLTRHHGLSANTIWMDLTSLYVIGFTTGWLSDRWRRERELGERIREMTTIKEIVDALHGDLLNPASAVRGLLDSLEPFERRLPGMVPAIRELDASFTSVQNVVQGLKAIRIDSNVRLVRLDWILASMERRLHGVTYPTPVVTLDWRCVYPTIPASAVALGSSIAALVLRMSPPAAGVWITISRTPRLAVLELHPRGAGPVPSFPRPTCAFVIASHVIRAHGGWIDDHLADPRDPRLSVSLPTVLKIRPLTEERYSAAEPEAFSPVNAISESSDDARRHAGLPTEGSVARIRA